MSDLTPADLDRMERRGQTDAATMTEPMRRLLQADVVALVAAARALTEEKNAETQRANINGEFAKGRAILLEEVEAIVMPLIGHGRHDGTIDCVRQVAARAVQAEEQRDQWARRCDAAVDSEAIIVRQLGQAEADRDEFARRNGILGLCNSRQTEMLREIEAERDAARAALGRWLSWGTRDQMRHTMIGSEMIEQARAALGEGAAE